MSARDLVERASQSLRALRGWYQEGPRRQRVATWVGLVALIGLALWARSGGVRRAAYAVRDELGVRLVEGHAAAIDRAAEESGVDPYLIAAVMFQESRGRVEARSGADALGLMQLRLPTAGDAARRLGLEAPTEEQLLQDAELNIRLGARHLAWLLEAGSDWNLEQVLVSYHCGRVGLKRRIAAAGSYEAWVREEQAKEEAGGRMSASLSYSWRVLDTMDYFRERGQIRS